MSNDFLILCLPLFFPELDAAIEKETGHSPAKGLAKMVDDIKRKTSCRILPFDESGNRCPFAQGCCCYNQDRAISCDTVGHVGCILFKIDKHFEDKSKHDILCDRCGNNADFYGKGGRCHECGDELCIDCAGSWNEIDGFDLCDRCNKEVNYAYTKN
jgi:hypothetical protein